MMRPGRPRKTICLPLPVFPKAEEIIFHITFIVDKVMSWLHTHSVPDFFDVIKSMKVRLEHECNRLSEIGKEMEPLAAAYNRFIDLQKERTQREKRIQRIIAVLGKQSDDLLKHDKEPDYPISGGMVIAIPREELPLWEAMKEYLHYVAEARIAEMESFFGSVFGVDFPANRQAIESALKRHKETFKVRKSKREKFISLKEKARD
jgi:hypothetical protein